MYNNYNMQAIVYSLMQDMFSVSCNLRLFSKISSFKPFVHKYIVVDVCPENLTYLLGWSNHTIFGVKLGL